MDCPQPVENSQKRLDGILGGSNLASFDKSRYFRNRRSLRLATSDGVFVCAMELIRCSRPRDRCKVTRRAESSDSRRNAGLLFCNNYVSGGSRSNHFHRIHSLNFGFGLSFVGGTNLRHSAFPLKTGKVTVKSGPSNDDMAALNRRSCSCCQCNPLIFDLFRAFPGCFGMTRAAAPLPSFPKRKVNMGLSGEGKSATPDAL